MVVAAVLSSVAAGCTSDGGGEASSTSVAGEVDRTIRSADLADAASLDAVQNVRFAPGAADAAAAVLGSDATGGALWAAAYVYATSGEDPGPLLELLNASDPSVRAIAAAGLLGRGHIEGFDPLIASLGVADPLEGADPPEPVWAFAADVLARYTQTGFGPDLSARPADVDSARQRWTAWLAANASVLRFDSASQTWVTG